MIQHRPFFSPVRTNLARAIAVAGIVFALALASVRLIVAAPLSLAVYTADEQGLGATSTLIYGDREAILVDTQFRISDAEKLADLIAAKGRHLKAILISHPHFDHYFGASVLLKRFPGTPVYATATDVEFIENTLADRLARYRKAFGADNIPADIPIPKVMPGAYFFVDGQAVQVLTDLQGDVGPEPSNNIVWVQSLEAAIAGDIVFNQQHLSLGATNAQSRQAWRLTLRMIRGINPRILVAGHKNRPDLPDNLDALAFDEGYLSDFETALAASHTAQDLIAAMNQKYPGIGGERTLLASAKALLPE